MSWETGRQQPYPTAVPASQALPAERAGFIRRTYAHLAGAVGAFVGLEFLLLGPLKAQVEPLIFQMMATRWGWLVVLGLFMAVGYVADKWARSARSAGMQYLGLGLYVAAEAVIFLPLLYVAAFYTSPEVLPTAALLTGTLFAGLTGTVFILRKDFSWMRSILMVGSFIALGIILCAILFGFQLGTLFSVAMVVLAAGYILYYTSNVLHHYRTDQHVAASLALFAAVALMFWYILRILLDRR
ncbi:MAG: Bax inhibitor-1/YccA family protein [Deltaproteobacteria bacterium]|nr:Bax inhibitor-1/YccA family protein [Deltaproteobacteria bacterium]